MCKYLLIFLLITSIILPQRRASFGNTGHVYELLSTTPINNPTDISGLSFWVDAMDSSTITKDGNNYVSIWKDKSAYGNNLIQNTGANQPLYNITGLNGKPALTANGSAPHKSMSTGIPVYIINPYTIFIVVNATVPNSADCIMLLSGSGSTSFFYMDIYYDGKISVAGPNEMKSSSGVYTIGTSVSFSTTKDISNLIKSYLNGIQKASGTYSGIMNSTNLYILDVNAGSPFGGALSEVIIYNSALSDTDRLKVEAYLKAKWGL